MYNINVKKNGEKSMKLLIFLTTIITIIHVDSSRCKLRNILQFTVRSTIAVTVFPIPLLTTRV